MAKAKEACALCGAKISVVSFCPRCGQPTRHMSASERVMWELGQWEASRGPAVQPARSTAAVPAQPAARAAEAPAPRRRRREQPAQVVSVRTQDGAVMHKLRRSESAGSAVATALAQAEPAAAEPAAAAPAPHLTAVPAPAEPRAPRRRRPAEEPQRADPSPKSEPTLELQPGEAVLGELKGWSRLRRSTLIVTNFRVALLKYPRQLTWIPLEHVEAVTVRLRGKALRFESTIEMLNIESRNRENIAEIRELAERFIAAAKRPGARYDATLVQEWCDRSSEMWDSHTGRVRLWIRRHPIAALGLAGTMVALAKIFGPSH